MDTFEYTRLLEQLLNGKLMDISKIPGGYPLFLYLINPFTSKVIYISLIQNIITFILGGFLIYTINKFYKHISLFISLAISLFVLSHFNYKYDTMVITESIFTNSLILIFILFVWALLKEKKIYWILLSISMFFPLFTRPNGLFIIGVFIVLLAFLIKYSKKNILYFMVPFIFMNFLWCIYNYSQYKIFIIGNPIAIYDVLGKTHNYHVVGNLEKINKTLKNTDSSLLPPLRNNPYYKQISNLNFINTSYYFFKSFTYTQYHYGILNERYNLLFEKKWVNHIIMPGYTYFIASDSLKKLTFKEYYTIDKMHSLKNNYLNVHNNVLFNLHDYFYLKIYNPLFKNIIWVILSMVTFIISIYIFIKSKFNNTGSIILMFLFTVFFCNLFVIIFSSGPGHGFERYCYPTEFVYYLSIALFPILFNKINCSNN